MLEKILKKKNTYRDSVFLMVINQEVRSNLGINEIVVMMGTDCNKGVIKDVGFNDPEIESATANDVVICIRAESEKTIEDALKKIEEMLTKKPAQGHSEGVFKTLESAKNEIPSMNFAIISIPGAFAAREARKALNLGLNVLLFSDNVPLKDEIALKKLAFSLDRIVMGPDCGTAIINNTPLAFANAVNSGSIGLVAASGTGMQEVVSLIDRNGEGVSQAIGTGGRDLTDAVGGMSMLKGIEILEKDDETDIIVLVSKPPGLSTTKKILERLKGVKKKVVVCFLGSDQKVISRYGIIPARSLEESALLAVAIVRKKQYVYKDFTISKAKLNDLLKKETEQMNPNQKYLRGLYSGGTLCDEAMLIISDSIGKLYSNTPLWPEYKLGDLSKGFLNSCIDLGDDYFTRGKPHPMIDPETRKHFIVKEADDPKVAILLLDIVLGYGAHSDMAGALANSIILAKSKVRKRGGYLSVIASVTGTEKDPQAFTAQTRKLIETGAIVMPSNAQAARFAARICSKINDLN
jgi:FdrA protein